MDSEYNEYNEHEKSEARDSSDVCRCPDKCQCGKYRRPIYYEVDIKQYVDTLNDWD